MNLGTHTNGKSVVPNSLAHPLGPEFSQWVELTDQYAQQLQTAWDQPGEVLPMLDAVASRLRWLARPFMQQGAQQRPG